MTIEEQWRSLETESAASDGWHLQLTRPVKGHLLFAAVEGTRRSLLLRVPQNVIPPKHHWPVIAGLDMVAINLAGHVYFGVMLREPRFSDVFAALAEDLTRRVEDAGEDAKEAVLQLLGQLARWQRFLAASAAGLSSEAQRGLWGELHFLHAYLLPALGGAAVSGWKGPTGAHQDFQYPEAWVEVKTTLAKQPQAVRITSERQLDDTRAPLLFLCVLMLESHEGGPATLPWIVAQVRAALGSWPSARESFEESLLAARYLDAHAHRYAATGYAVRQTDMFQVGPGFPRIIERDLPSGVGDASYKLSLAACIAFAASIETVMTALLSPKTET